MSAVRTEPARMSASATTSAELKFVKSSASGSAGVPARSLSSACTWASVFGLMNSATDP
jgi:hypothetical protein